VGLISRGAKEPPIGKFSMIFLSKETCPPNRTAIFPSLAFESFKFASPLHSNLTGVEPLVGSFLSRYHK